MKALSFIPIHVYNPTEGSYSNKKYCRIQIFGDKIYNNMIKHGVVEHKTDKLKAPNISKEFKKDLEKIDTPDQEVMVEIIVTEVSTEVIEEYGSDFFGLTTEGGEDNQSLEYDTGDFLLESIGSSGEIMAELTVFHSRNPN